MYCFEHKKDGMIDVKNKTCEENGCVQRPTFNKLGETKGIYCKKHKKINMVDVMSKTCEENECSKRPHFSHPGETKPAYCSKHKKAGMVSVESKTCVECTAEAQWGKSEFHRPQWCTKHKPDHTVDIAKERRCQECTEDYAFLVDGAKFCATHCPESSYMEMTKRLCK